MDATKIRFMDEEIWMPVEGYSDTYQVSNLGRVKTMDKVVNHNYGGKALKLSKVLKLNLYGRYPLILLTKEGKAKGFSVHSLIATAFVAKPISDKKLEVNHKDGNKLNNRADNLEWVTRSENNKHAFRTGLNKAQRKGVFNTYCVKPVLQIDLNGQVVKEWRSMIEAERNGFHAGHISGCCNGKRKTHGKHTWMQKN